MFSAALRGQSWFLFSALVGALLLACAAFSIARRRGVRPWEFAGLTALVAAEVSVTLLLPNGGYTTRTCVVNRDVFEPLLTEQGLLNLLMFLPIGIAGVLATRSVLPTVAGCAALSMGTELAQAAVPGIGRNCDSSDFTMNVAGAAVGAAIAWAILNKPGSAVPLERHWRPTAYSFTAVAVAAAIIGITAVQFISMDSTSIQFASGSQKSAAQEAMHASFGDRYAITKVQFQPPVGGGSDRGTIGMILDGGKANAALTWPDNQVLTVSFENSDRTTSESFPVDGAGKPPTTGAEALAIATKYAHQYHPEALQGSRSTVAPVDPDAKLGWMVSWRRLNTAGVLMPMRLDVEINRAGRISQLVSADIGDPTGLPPVKITKSQAVRRARESIGKLLHDGQNLKVAEVSLRADDRTSAWRTEYVVSYVEPDGTQVQSISYVDATTGSTVSE
ncbi:VanZ family protein [Streptomyces sp. NBC_01476]|uniref:VanZ family protein n=1 Tax=Streptomyces sp. NBC_01476 TaxID=2903881 RepID=UPI002E30A922|nr:VanZ family protein [Streptomyces sp. NBC_01476]